MKAIETRYNGYRFRSRLEARWAVFFDYLGMAWEYEIEGYELGDGRRYLPDFRLTIAGRSPIWFEVKGKPPSDEDISKGQILANGTNMPLTLAWGTMGVPVLRTSGSKLIVEGAPLLQILPDSYRFSGSPADRKSIEANSLEAMKTIGLSLISSFYENDVGEIDADFLYEVDLPFLKEPALRSVARIALDGNLVPGFNSGLGRLYRSSKLRDAYSAARSSRFEFGESGSPRKSP